MPWLPIGVNDDYRDKKLHLVNIGRRLGNLYSVVTSEIRDLWVGPKFHPNKFAKDGN